MSQDDNSQQPPYPPSVIEPSEVAEPLYAEVSGSSGEQEIPGDRQDRYQRTADLIRGWIDEEDGYDAEVWPLLAQELHTVRRDLGAP